MCQSASPAYELRIWLPRIRRHETREPLIRGLEERERRRGILTLPHPFPHLAPPAPAKGVHVPVVVMPMPHNVRCRTQCSATHAVGEAALFFSVRAPRPYLIRALKINLLDGVVRFRRARRCGRDTVRGRHCSREHTGVET